MSRWFILLFLPSDVFSLGNPRYECGQHGRFEYCIDGVPGCIVGCHCHPGYYFDTDTKICEPNEKLVQDYRRLFKPEPTRVQIPMTPPDNMEPLPTPTTKNPLDNQVEAIAKDTDDLGDWLYNQFFKNLDTKFENKTSTEVPTRRSGSGVKFKETNDFRRRFKSKKKKYKNNDLKRKLLRITEDDSLFDSDSESDDSEDSSDSDDTDIDSTTKKHAHDHNHDSQEHGHKKILVINRKPKPTLPSFIFLPNLDTPFFPPIGLPPPMYPMIPVPPMPIPFPYPPPPPPTAATSESSPVTDVTKPTNPATNATEPNDHSVTTPDPLTTPHDNSTNSTEYRYRHNLQRGRRKKLLRQLQNHMIDLPTQFDHNNHDENEPPDDIDMGESPLHMRRSSPELQEDVKFKYLSQLIHKMNPSKHEESQQEEALPNRRRANDDYGPIPPLPQHAPTRKYPGRLLETDDAYYATLGQQIASLIRRIDAKGDTVYQPETGNYKIQQPNFVDNSYVRLSPRSYWERSVRSPLNHYQRQPVLEGYQRDYENNLFNIESKVEVVATTEYTLSLNELENAIYLMDRAKTQLQHKMKTLKNKGLQGSLNINLLPRHDDAATSPHSRSVTSANRIAQLFPTVKPVIQRKTSNMSNDIINLSRNLHYNLRGILMQNFKNALNNNTKTSFSHGRPVKSNNMYSPATNAAKTIQIIPIEQERISNLVLPNEAKSRIKLNINVQHPRPPLTQSRRAPSVLHVLRNVKPYGERSKYLGEEFTPFQINSSARHENGGSYFHHELHHFDYFD